MPDSTELDSAAAPVDSDGADRDDVAEGGELPTRKLMFLAIGFTAAYLLISLLDVWWAASRQTESSASAAVVLGAAQYNGEPSGVLKARLDTAADLWTDNRVELVVVTGGGQAADVTTEAKTGYDYLREVAGMSDEELRLEVQGSSTYESLAAVARFLEREGIVDVILVTDPYHARRSQLVAEEVGLDAAVYSTGTPLTLDRLARETLAVAAGRIISFRRLDSYIFR